MISTKDKNKLDLKCNYIQNKISKYCKLLSKTLLKLFTFEVLQNNFCFQAFNMINNKVCFLETSKSCSPFITIDFDLNDPKLLALFSNLSFLLFNKNFSNNIDPKELQSFLSP